jgi:hypothetical protein
MPLVHKKLTANFTMMETQLFYETQLLLPLRLLRLLLLLLLRRLQLETDQSKDYSGGINFKDTAAACRQLCKFRRRQLFF